MKKINYLLLLVCLTISFTLKAKVNDDPIITKLMIDQLEIRDAESDNQFVLEAELWIGKDLNKFWVKTEIEKVGSNTEEAELQLLYSRAIAPFWDFQLGVRRDFKPKPTRDWFAIGFKGLAPYYFEIDTALFLGEDNRTALRVEAEYEMMLTQKLVLSPEIEANFYSKTDDETEVGSGLSDLSIGLRLRYEIKREFAPYIGVNWSKKYGGTANFARTAGEKTSDTQFVIGLRAWF